MQSNNFRAIGFDYGGVIAGVSGVDMTRRIINFLGVDLRTFQNVYFEFNHLVNNGVLSRDDFWRKVTAELGVSDKCNAIIDFLKTLPHDEINPQMIKLVRSLRNKGYKTGLLSNNTSDATARFQNNALEDIFDVIVVSADIGYSKPDPKAFEIFVDRLGINANELIFIDDTERSLINANKIGFTPILFVDYRTLLRDLDNLGINTEITE